MDFIPFFLLSYHIISYHLDDAEVRVLQPRVLPHDRDAHGRGHIVHAARQPVPVGHVRGRRESSEAQLPVEDVVQVLPSRKQASETSKQASRDKSGASAASEESLIDGDSYSYSCGLTVTVTLLQ